jgi:hypothetical protein
VDAVEGEGPFCVWQVGLAILIMSPSI